MSTPQTTQELRTQFETWATQDQFRYDVRKAPQGHYADSTTLLLWFAWEDKHELDHGPFEES